jgi:hypothetical protein
MTGRDVKSNEREKSMTFHKILDWARFAAVAALSAIVTVAALTAVAQAADVAADSLKFGAGVTRAPEGYETSTVNYIVANPTSVFSDHFYYGGKVTGELKRGDRVDVLAKVKGYDWVLVGKGGTGIGYVPISMLSPADQYHP